MARHVESKAVSLCLVLLFANAVSVANAVSLARHLRGQQTSMSISMDLDGACLMPEGIDVAVVNKTLPKTKESNKCLCPMGQFWHWRLASCIHQGPWGYECGFFPMEHHHRVCIDHLKCEALSTVANSTARYVPHGDSLKAKSFPASCTRCNPEDGCLVGQKRMDEECLKQYTIEGKKACVTLKVTTIASAVASATESYTATAQDSHKASAEAKVTASHISEKSSKATANADSKATVTATESASAKANAEASASASATASGSSTQTATAKESASAEASATESSTKSAKASKSSNTVGESAGIKVEIADQASGESTITKKITETAKATQSAEASAEGSGSATAEGSSTATAKGSGPLLQKGLRLQRVLPLLKEVAQQLA